MHHYSSARLLLVLLALFLVLMSASCASDTDIVITFDGNECIYEGPTEVETGNQIIKVRNTSGANGSLDVCRINEGFGWQDTLDFIGEPGSEVEWPHYCPSGAASNVVDADSNEVVHEYKLRYAGEYHAFWKQTGPLPQKTWPCAAFDVIEAAAE